MKNLKIILLTLSMIVSFIGNTMNAQITYTMPSEDEPHEGTWLQWPHQYEYGVAYRNSLDATWVAMTAALVSGEKVHIIAYNTTEQTRITNLLTAAGVSLTNVNFKLFQTNDVWVRDNGPIFVRDATGNLKIEDWGFNGWGGKYGYLKCNVIPTSIATAISVPVVNLNSVMTCEGGAVEIDGNGVLLACRSSIISQTPANSVRNAGMTQAQAEAHFTTNLGVTKFIWLNGVTGTTDITDFHIDGFAKFVNDTTLLTMNNTDLLSWGTPAGDITNLYNASNISGKVYHKVYVPLSVNNVTTTTGTDLGYQGSYCNYYVANGKVLVPNYNDPNDAVANAIIQGLYPGRTVVGIDVRNLYENGGMVHCVTQQQPVATMPTGLIENITNNDVAISQNFPNPVKDYSTIGFSLQKSGHITLEIYDALGQLISTIVNEPLTKGEYAYTINSNEFSNGIYTYTLKLDNTSVISKRMIVIK